MKPELDQQPNQSTPEPINSTEQKDKNSNRSIGKRAGGALFWNIVFLPVKASLGLVVSLVIIKLFLRDAYAALATVTALLALLGMLTDLGIERALPRFVGEIEVKLGRSALRRFVFNVTILKLAILAVVIIFFTSFADMVVNDWFRLGIHGRVYLALICTLLVLGAFYDVATQVLYSFFKQKVTNLLDIVVTVMNPLLTLILILWFRWEVYGVILALLFTTIVSVIIATWQAWLASKDAVEKPNLKKTQPLKVTTESAADAGYSPLAEKKTTIWWRFTRYSALMYFFNISAFFYDANFAILILQYYREAAAAVIIRLVYSFIKTLLKNLLAPFNGVQTPLFSSIHAEGKQAALDTAYASISKLQLFILIPSGIGVIILARNLLELLMLRQSADAVLTPDLLPTATLSVILTVIFTFAEAIISLPMVILMVYEKYFVVIMSRILPLLTGPLLIGVAVFGGGAIAAIVVMGAGAVISRIIAMVVVQRTMGLVYPIKFFWKVTKATAAFGVPLQILVWLLPVNWPVTASVAVAGVLIFWLVFKKLGGFDPEDKKRLQTLKLPLRGLVIKYL